MLDPDFDPLEDLHNVMLAVSAQHYQIDQLIKVMNEHNRAIQNINNALRVSKNQIALMEKHIYEIKQATARDCPGQQ